MKPYSVVIKPYWTIILPPLAPQLAMLAPSAALAWYDGTGLTLTRGNFREPALAWRWAQDNLAGLPWELRRVTE